MLALLLVAGPAAAQDDLEDVFGGLGTASTAEEVDDEAGRQAGEGTLRGQVIDQATGYPVPGVSVIVVHPEPGDGSPRNQQVVTTDADGVYRVPSLPPGRYDLSFVKAGYRSSAMTGFEVLPDQINIADFPIPPRASDGAAGVLDLDEFVVTADAVGDMMSNIELRLESDSMLDIMSAEDFSKYAASDVADALKRVVGVNVVEGQFAIIRGLEDRYSSTTYNGATVPSPDPDRQSVQLDLFPSEVVSNVVVAKSFSPELPGNSAGGSIDIITHGYPEEALFTSFKLKGGLNDRVQSHGFMDFVDGNPVGKEHNGSGPFETEIGGTVGGRFEKWEREFRFNTVANFNRDFGQQSGWVEKREPRNRNANRPDGDLSDGELSLTGGRFDLEQSDEDTQLTVFGAMGFDIDEDGDHQIDGSFFWTRKKNKLVQTRSDGFLPGFDYDPIRDLTIDEESISQENFDGTSTDEPGVNAASSAWITAIGARDIPSVFPTRGFLWFTSFGESASFKVERDLKIYQLNGDHELDRLLPKELEGFHLRWATNYARTSQDETALRMRYWVEPCGFAPSLSVLACPPGVSRIDVPTRFPVTPQDVLPGKWATNRQMLQSANEIDEDQWFARFDLEYEREVTDWLEGKLSGGYWYEKAKRNVKANFVDPSITVFNTASCPPDVCLGGQTEPLVVADSPLQLGEQVFDTAFVTDENGLFRNSQQTSNDSEREIQAGYLGLKATFVEDVDVLAGLRIEDIRITSNTDAFRNTDQLGFGIDQFDLLYPTKFLIFDRFGDNRLRERTSRAPPYNDELIGFDVKRGICHQRTTTPGEPLSGAALTTPGLPGECTDLVTIEELEQATSGEIDTTKILPSVGLTWRVTPLEQYLPWGSLTFRAAYSQTVARPSFREKSYYVSLEPGSDDQILGNPQLDLSKVQSWDGRLEWVWSSGDLMAFSAFYKEIDDPVESIILRNPTDATGSTFQQYRTFFNNPSTAKLWGIEVEARKSLDFVDDWLDTSFFEYWSLGGNYTYIHAEVDRTEAELDRAEIFFASGDTLKKTRRLFGQPEWIGNVDISFDQPDWGTKVTVAYFAISDILDASGVFGPAQPARSYQPDLYVDSFYQLDLVARQELWEGIELSFQAKNLTDSKRGTAYDPDNVKGKVRERQYRVGRDFKLQLTFSFSRDSWF